MKIGILTFHWATNYGAVLQTYSMQNCLQSLGHEVEIINYKPRNRDHTIWNFIRHRCFIDIVSYINDYKKEQALSLFRLKYLILTDRIYKTKDIIHNISKFDVIISGSDQVMCASFLRFGEGRGKQTPVYFLGFPFNGIKIAYAVSFGTTAYPEDLIPVASKYLKSFKMIGVRENTGIDVVKTMGRDDAIVVPDPTLLSGTSLYECLSDNSYDNRNDYTFCFFIRNICDRRKNLSDFRGISPQIWNNDDGNYTIGNWISKIMNANLVVTDSYHCMIMCLKFHVNFAVITETEGVVGMNDRFYTLLEIINLRERVICRKDISELEYLFKRPIDWLYVDCKMDELSKYGSSFIHNCVSDL